MRIIASSMVAALVAFVAACKAPAHEGESADATTPPLPDGTTADTSPATGSYHAQGNKIFDPCGESFSPRGVEMIFSGYQSPTNIAPDPRQVDGAAKVGINTARMLFYYGYANDPAPYGSASYAMSVSQIETIVQSAIADHLMPELAVSGGQDPTIFTSAHPEMVAMLANYDGKIALHAVGEGGTNNDGSTQVETTAQWVTRAQGIIRNIRAAGITRSPLYVMAPQAGRYVRAVLDGGQQVVDADPEHNVIIAWQAYWNGGPDDTGPGRFQTENGVTLREAFQQLSQKNFPVQVGLVAASPEVTPDYISEMALAQQYGLGWTWWSWTAAGSTLVLSNWDAGPPFGSNVWHTGASGSGQADAAKIAVTDANSLHNTSKRTFYQLNGACQ